MDESSLPRELQLIIDDIVEQNVHLLEWEVFGNTTEDMRVVLTWRRIEHTKKGNRSRWKLRNSSLDDGLDETKKGEKDKSSNIGDESYGNGEHEEELEEGDKRLNETRSKEEEDKANAANEADDAETDAKKKTGKKKGQADWKANLRKKKLRKDQKVSDSQDNVTEGTGEGVNDLDGERGENEGLDSNEASNINMDKPKNEDEESEESKKARLLEEEDNRLNEGENLEDVAQKEGDDKLDGEEEGDANKGLDSNEASNINMDEAKNEDEESEESKKAKLLEEETNRLNESGKLEDDEEIDLNAKIPHTKEEATKMLQIQRSKFQMAIDQANLDEEEMKKRFPKGIMNSIYGEDWDPSRIPTDGQNWQCNGIAADSKDCDINSFRTPGVGGEWDINSPYYSSDNKGMGTDLSGMYRGLDGKGLGSDLSGMYGGYDGRGMGTGLPGMYGGYHGRGMGPDMFGMYGGSGFVYNPKQMASGYEYEYHGKVYQSKKIKKHKLKGKKFSSYDRRPGRPVIRVISKCFDTKGWQNCVDCRYNDFCDNPKHKDEYMHMLFEDAKQPLDVELEDCKCNVCTGGAVHNGCFYRELLRLKSEYLIFDKYNYCFCSECIPFKYRRMCLRQELKLFRHEGSDHYYRLTTHDGDDGIVRNQLTWQQSESLDSNYGSDEEEDIGYGFIQAILLDDIKMELTRDDKISFRDCPDCQCNGFCDNIRHKKLYHMLLCIDDEDFDVLQDDCWCLVCEFNGAAHSGCAERELRRLKYDLMLFDVRNLCYCHECVPFKYRKICLRQEMKMKRRQRGINLYHHLL